MKTKEVALSSRYLKVVALILGVILLIGCSQKELDTLRNEVSTLRTNNTRYESKIDSLKKEISVLKTTDPYYYQQAAELADKQRYQEARDAFQSLISKYPLSHYTPQAKQQISTINVAIAREEKRVLAEQRQRQEDAKYVARSQEEAMNEWIMFRSNEKKYKGTVTTWRFPVSGIYSENLFGYIDSEHGKNAVTVYGTGDLTYQAAAMLGKMPKVVKRDWIVVTGRLLGVNSENEIVLSPIRVKNEGYKE